MTRMAGREETDAQAWSTETAQGGAGGRMQSTSHPALRALLSLQLRSPSNFSRDGVS